MIFLCLLLLISISCAYLPGIAMHTYAKNELMPVKVNSLTSESTFLPQSYDSFKSCPLNLTTSSQSYRENLGELLWGDKILNSNYIVRMGSEVKCRKICTATYTKSELKRLEDLIRENYQVNLILDNLPITQYINTGNFIPSVYKGFPLGFQVSNQSSRFVVFNHVHFDIHINNATVQYEYIGNKLKRKEGYNVVGFYVAFNSVKASKYKDCNGHTYPMRENSAMPVYRYYNDTVATTRDKHITWSYSYAFTYRQDVSWGSRWDAYLNTGSKNTAKEVLHLSLVTLVMVFLFVTCMSILGKFISKDLARYRLPSAESDETGWKLIYGDVFRCPSHSRALANLVGAGAQLGCMALCVLLLGCMGILAPSQRGKLLVSALFFLVVSNTLGGFITGLFLKYFGKNTWRNAFLASLTLPAVMFLVYSVVQLVEKYSNATTAIPLPLFLFIFLFWAMSQAIFTVSGASIAYKSATIVVPCCINKLPRAVPKRAWYSNPYIVATLFGCVPFSICITELTYIYTSLWKSHVFCLFGFFLATWALLTLGTAMNSLVFVYIQLNEGNHRWWWPCFLSGASVAVYTFLFSLSYLRNTMHISLLGSVVIYTAYTSLISVCLGLYCGAVSLIACFAFIKFLYGAIQLD